MRVGFNDSLFSATHPVMVHGNSTHLFVNRAQYGYALLLIVPFVCTFGNSLVVLAVVKYKHMKTCTNFLIVSLAVADLSIGIFVMPLAVFVLMNQLQWTLGRIICRIWVVVDVIASTASIINLVLISIDRLFAVVRHTEYQTPIHKRRVYAAIAFCWIFSVGIGVPLGVGFDEQAAESTHCGIVDPDYMLYGSVFAFYIPCAVIVATYGYIFHALRARMRAVQLQEMTAGNLVGMSFGMKQSAKNMASIENPNEIAGWEHQVIEQLRKVLDENADGLQELSESDRKQLNEFMNTNFDNINAVDARRLRQQFTNSDLKAIDAPESRARRSSQTAARLLRFVPKLPGKHKEDKKKMIGMKQWAIQMFTRLKSKDGIALRRERRATKLVAIVMVMFLLCWLPFFTLNIYKLISLWRQTWSTSLEMLFIIFSWLGYLNSCLNPICYAAINVKFRAAFIDLLGLGGKNPQTSAYGRNWRSTRRQTNSKRSQSEVGRRKTWLSRLVPCISRRSSDGATSTSLSKEKTGVQHNEKQIGCQQQLNVARHIETQSTGNGTTSNTTSKPTSTNCQANSPHISHKEESNLNNTKLAKRITAVNNRVPLELEASLKREQHVVVRPLKDGPSGKPIHPRIDGIRLSEDVDRRESINSETVIFV